MEHKDEIRTIFHDEGLPQEKTLCATHSATFIDLVYRIDKRYYPEALLDDCKYKVKCKTIKIHDRMFNLI